MEKRNLNVIVAPSLSQVWQFMTLWTAACQASLSFTVSWSLLKLCPLSQWCYPTISSSLIPFLFCLKSSQHQGFFQWAGSSHQLAKVLELQLQHQSFAMKIQCWCPVGLTGLISLLFKRLGRVFLAPRFENISLNVYVII